MLLPRQHNNGGVAMNKNPEEKLKLFALAKNGKSYSFSVPMKPDLDLLEESHAILLQRGFTSDELDDLILSTTKPEKVPPAEPVRFAVASELMLDETALPDIPQPEDENHLPPEKSSALLVNTHDITPFIYVWGDKGEARGAFVPAVLPYGTNPPFPISQIRYHRYWLRNNTYVIKGPQHFSKSINYTHGMSNTNRTTLSCELGVELKGLSAKLSKTIENEITISEQESVTDTFEFDAERGEIVVYTLWQLIDEFALTDDQGNPVEWRGIWGSRSVPWCAFPAKFVQNVFAHNSKVLRSDPVIFESGKLKVRKLEI
jgi:hypothetical protein